MTIRELLDDSNISLLDAEVLLAYALGEGREYLLRCAEEEVDEALAELFQSYVDRVFGGEPLAYITSNKEFFGYDFFVDKRVLIPRPETEMLVEEVINFMEQVLGEEERKFRILDLGTGSGNIAVSIAKYFFDKGLNIIEAIDALDVSENALEVARLNAGQHGVDHNIRFLQSDILETVDVGGFYDIIVANLPYIGERKHRYISRNAEKFEPKVALFGGDDGLRLYKKLFQELMEKKVGFCRLIGEFGFAQGEDLEIELSKYFDQGWKIKKDLKGIPRLFIINKKYA